MSSKRSHLYWFLGLPSVAERCLRSSFEEALTDVQQVYLVVTHTRTSGR